jgi:hypothetical protein
MISPIQPPLQISSLGPGGLATQVSPVSAATPNPYGASIVDTSNFYQQQNIAPVTMVSPRQQPPQTQNTFTFTHPMSKYPPTNQMVYFLFFDSKKYLLS